MMPGSDDSKNVCHFYVLKNTRTSPVVQSLESASKAGNEDPIPGQGTKIPRAAGQLSLRATTTEPARSGTHMPCEKATCHY